MWSTGNESWIRRTCGRGAIHGDVFDDVRYKGCRWRESGGWWVIVVSKKEDTRRQSTRSIPKEQAEM
jgi:hypothetical protein